MYWFPTVSMAEENLRQNLGLAAIFGNAWADRELMKRIETGADIGRDEKTVDPMIANRFEVTK